MRRPIIDNLITERPDGQIGDGVHVAYEWIIRDNAPRDLCRIYLGTRQSGPILQYDHDGRDRYNGRERVDMDGAWTPIYSRGNYGRNYACGGNWSGHNRNLHPDIQRMYYVQDETVSMPMILIDGELTPPPEGVKADGVLTSIDCSPSWSIFFPTAADAMRYRLSINQFKAALLPSQSRYHLLGTETQDVVDRVMEVINVYQL